MKVGISRAAKPRDLSREVTATVTPASKINMISFAIDNSARATVTPLGDTTSGNSLIRKFKVTGLDPTPPNKPNGDAEIQAKCTFAPKKPPKIVARCTVLVVIPKTQSHAVGAATMMNSAVGTNKPPFGPLWVLSTEFTAIVTITIKDQFGLALDSIYDGHKVVYEAFTQAVAWGGSGVPTSGAFIDIPDDWLGGGVKLDETGFVRSFNYNRSLTQAEVDAWVNLTGKVDGKNNAFDTVAQGFWALQSITVDGWRVTPDYGRKQETWPGPNNPVPYQVVDTAQ